MPKPLRLYTALITVAVLVVGCVDTKDATNQKKTPEETALYADKESSQSEDTKNLPPFERTETEPSIEDLSTQKEKAANALPPESEAPPSQSFISDPNSVSEENTNSANSSTKADPIRPTFSITVERIIDGDTIVAQNGERIRLLGIDTPELGRGEAVDECYAAESTQALKQLAPVGTIVELELDSRTKDRYGRTLAWLWSDGVLINEVLVLKGYARELTIPPNNSHSERIAAAESSARALGKGLWSACLNQ